MPSPKSKAPKEKNAGFSLVELMVAITIALITLAGVFTVFVTSVKSSNVSLKEIRLNQELRVLMDVMARDIRRAGFWSQADGMSVNPFATDVRAMRVLDGSCITYSYDLNSDNVVDHNDNQGFKLVGNVLTVRKTSASCEDGGGRKWASISDLYTLKIIDLTFDLKQNACLNLTNTGRSCDRIPVAGDTKDSGLVGDRIEIMYVVDIVLKGALKSDLSIVDLLEQTVSVRNTLSKEIL